MHFPTWVDRERDRRKRAQLRLKYMLFHATLRKYGRTSIHDLARDVGCNHSSIFNQPRVVHQRDGARHRAGADARRVAA